MATSIDELKDKFSHLTEQEKLSFMKAIMPSFCESFSRNPQGMMLFCQDMMKSCGMDMQGMMKVMMGMMGHDKSAHNQ